MLHPSTDIIMNAQQFFAAEQSEANLVKLLHAVSVMLQEGAEVLIPTAAEAPESQLLLMLSAALWSTTLKQSCKWTVLRALSLTLLPPLPLISKTK